MKHVLHLQKTARCLDLVDQVCAIIDSRIQFLEYENDRILNGCFDEPSPKKQLPTPEETTEVGWMVRKFDQLLDHARTTGRSLKLLFFLRTHLIRENARVVLDLLTNNRYLKYNEDHLGFMLQVERMN